MNVAAMKIYNFKIVLEPDEDSYGNPAWHARCPAVESLGAATSARTRDEALKNINEVIYAIAQEFVEEGSRFLKVPRAPATWRSFRVKSLASWSLFSSASLYGSGLSGVTLTNVETNRSCSRSGRISFRSAGWIASMLSPF